MLAVGIALGALIGPGPASSLASGTRAAAVARVLALLALGRWRGRKQPGTAGGQCGTGAAEDRGERRRSERHRGLLGERRRAPSPEHGRGAVGNELDALLPRHPAVFELAVSDAGQRNVHAVGSRANRKPVRLPPIAHVWLIVLPYGESFASLLGQSVGGAVHDGSARWAGNAAERLLLAAGSQLAGAATLLSGQVQAAVSTIVAPCPGTQDANATAAPAGAPATSTPSRARLPRRPRRAPRRPNRPARRRRTPSCAKSCRRSRRPPDTAKAG